MHEGLDFLDLMSLGLVCLRNMSRHVRSAARCYIEMTELLEGKQIGDQECSVVVQSLSHVQLCDAMDCNTPGFPVLHHLLKLVQTHVH